MNEMTPNLITVRQFCQRHPWPTHGGLRWLIYNAQENGLSKCILRIGRRVLIDEKAFFRWAETHRDAS